MRPARALTPRHATSRVAISGPTQHPTTPRVAALIMVALFRAGLVRSLSRVCKSRSPQLCARYRGRQASASSHRDHPGGGLPSNEFVSPESSALGGVAQPAIGVKLVPHRAQRLSTSRHSPFGKGPDYLWLISSTRQITPPTKNGHAPPPIESRKSSQSVNPYYVRTW